jgi:regulator of sigma E protease
MLTVVAFLAALGLLIAIHEYGHYKVATLCGVKVLKFSIGFGKTLYSWRLKGKPTEFAVSWLPLGGFVRMLDEREGPVDPAERHLAFNTQPLRKRAAIVAAGPAANLLLAVLLYAGVNWWGLQEPRAVLSSPTPLSVAQAAGVRGGELVRALRVQDGDGFGAEQEVVSFEDLRWQLTQAVLSGRDVELLLQSAKGTELPSLRLALSDIDAKEADAQLMRRVGIVMPWTEAVLGAVQADGAAQAAGLREGDKVLRLGDTPVVDGMQLRELIRQQKQGEQALTKEWRVQRDEQVLVLSVTPKIITEGAQSVARIGAFVGAPPEMVTVRHGLLDGLGKAVERTWEVSILTLKMLGKMVIGEASLKNISGPLTIADYAGKTAAMGMVQYLLFLALISVSLGVLNLLPLPVLDGGHLMYYLWEGVTGREVSTLWLERLQRGGVAILVAMMGVALFNDITRLLG